MAMTKTNNSTKALKSAMAKAKKLNERAALEYAIAIQTNPLRGLYFNQDELMELYARDSWNAPQGASKTCHTVSHEGWEFQYIVVKRHQTHGHIFATGKGTGNQLIDEIDCWNELVDTEDSDLLCPILKYFTSKSDKVSATSKTMQRNVLIIAQKAVKVGNAEYACRKAEELNRENGYNGERASVRYEKLKALGKKRGWKDVMRNGGNSGVIFDYHKNCYKAVFIDYAL